MKILAVLGILALAAGAALTTRRDATGPRRQYVLIIDESRSDGETAEPAVSPAETVRLARPDGVEELPLDEYLIGVVMAETLPTFSVETLKAQAVAARTFTWKTRRAGKHPDADVCDDPSCCQAYGDPEELREKYGDAFETARKNAAAAVAATDGEAIYYRGELIDAVYFSCSGGNTEAAAAVWGGDVPYLQTVESPGEEFSPKYSADTAVSLTEFRRAMAEAGVELPVIPEDWLGDVVRSEGGGVETIRVGGKEMSGTEMRRIFSLPSARFTVEILGSDVVFHTMGYGHRVGMSQYGAEAMAREGKTYREILRHYYTGVEIR